MHYNLITFVGLRRNSNVLIVKTCMASIWRLNDQNFWVLSQNDESDQIIVKSMQCTIIWSLSSFCDKTQKFWSLRRQIDAMHYNLITFIGLRCFECFATYLNILDCFDVKSMQSIVIWSLSSFRDVTQKFWSFRRQIDAMHYNLITFVVLRQNSKVLIVKTSNRCHAL